MRQNFITGVGKIKIVPIGRSGSGFIGWAKKQDGAFENRRPVIIQQLAEVRDRLIGVKKLAYPRPKAYLPQVAQASCRRPVIVGRPDRRNGSNQKSRAL